MASLPMARSSRIWLNAADVERRCETLRQESSSLIAEYSKGNSTRLADQARELRKPAIWAKHAVWDGRQREDGASRAPHPGCRPTSPTSHMRGLQQTVHKDLSMMACTEHHRDFWKENRPTGRMQTVEGTGAKLPAFDSKRGQIFDVYPSDYREANWHVENAWALRSLNRSQSEPNAAAVGLPKKPRTLNPSMISRGVTSCMVGRSGDRLRALYEDSWGAFKHDYDGPEFGLSTSDVTRMGDQMVRQKALMRAGC